MNTLLCWVLLMYLVTVYFVCRYKIVTVESAVILKVCLHHPITFCDSVSICHPENILCYLVKEVQHE